MIIISIAAGNHDPVKFENPDVFDINRSTVGYLGFGRGVHGCMGIHVAKLEAHCLKQLMVERVKCLSLVGDPTYKLNNMVRSLAILPGTVET